MMTSVRTPVSPTCMLVMLWLYAAAAVPFVADSQSGLSGTQSDVSEESISALTGPNQQPIAFTINLAGTGTGQVVNLTSVVRDELLRSIVPSEGSVFAMLQASSTPIVTAESIAPLDSVYEYQVTFNKVPGYTITKEETVLIYVPHFVSGGDCTARTLVHTLTIKPASLSMSAEVPSRRRPGRYDPIHHFKEAQVRNMGGRLTLTLQWGTFVSSFSNALKLSLLTNITSDLTEVQQPNGWTARRASTPLEASTVMRVDDTTVQIVLAADDRYDVFGATERLAVRVPGCILNKEGMDSTGVVSMISIVETSVELTFKVDTATPYQPSLQSDIVETQVRAGDTELFIKVDEPYVRGGWDPAHALLIIDGITARSVLSSVTEPVGFNILKDVLIDPGQIHLVERPEFFLLNVPFQNMTAAVQYNIWNAETLSVKLPAAILNSQQGADSTTPVKIWASESDGNQQGVIITPRATAVCSTAFTFSEAILQKSRASFACFEPPNGGFLLSYQGSHQRRSSNQGVKSDYELTGNDNGMDGWAVNGVYDLGSTLSDTLSTTEWAEENLYLRVSSGYDISQDETIMLDIQASGFAVNGGSPSGLTIPSSQGVPTIRPTYMGGAFQMFVVKATRITMTPSSINSLDLQRGRITLRFTIEEITGHDTFIDTTAITTANMLDFQRLVESQTGNAFWASHGEWAIKRATDAGSFYSDGNRSLVVQLCNSGTVDGSGFHTVEPCGASGTPKYTYGLMAADTVSFGIPPGLLDCSTGNVTVSDTLTIVPSTFHVSGSIYDQTQNLAGSIRTGLARIVIEIKGGGAFNPLNDTIREAWRANIRATTNQANGWNANINTLLCDTCIDLPEVFSGSTLSITVGAVSTYAPTYDEVIMVTIPGMALGLDDDVHPDVNLTIRSVSPSVKVQSTYIDTSLNVDAIRAGNLTVRVRLPTATGVKWKTNQALDAVRPFIRDGLISRGKDTDVSRGWNARRNLIVDVGGITTVGTDLFIQFTADPFFEPVVTEVINVEITCDALDSGDDLCTPHIDCPLVAGQLPIFGVDLLNYACKWGFISQDKVNDVFFCAWTNPTTGVVMEWIRTQARA